LPSELPPVTTGGELEPDGRIRSVVDRLMSAPVRGEDGRFVRGAFKTGEHSDVFWSELQPVKQAIVDRVRQQLAVDTDDADGRETLAALIDGFAEAHLLRKSIFLRMCMQGGPVTNKGKMRAIVQAWSTFFDRELRTIERLGIVRKARRTQTPIEWLESLDHQEGSAHEHPPHSTEETGETVQTRCATHTDRA
jgi:hypothetical protein